MLMFKTESSSSWTGAYPLDHLKYKINLGSGHIIPHGKGYTILKKI